MKQVKIVAFILYLSSWIMFSQSINVYAQSSSKDVIYLKGGGIVRGVIIKQDQAQVTIQTEDGQKLSYKMLDVSRIEIKKSSSNTTTSRNQPVNKQNVGKKSKSNNTSLLIGIYSSATSPESEDLKFVDNVGLGIGLNGKLFLNKIAIGLDMGFYDFYNNKEKIAVQMIPVCVSLEYYASRGVFSPYIGIDSGLYTMITNIETTELNSFTTQTLWGVAPKIGFVIGGRTIKWMLQSRYHNVMSDNNVSSTFSINTGVFFGF